MAEGRNAALSRLAAGNALNKTSGPLRPNYARVKQEVHRLLTEFQITEPPVDPVYISRNLGVEVVFGEFIGGSTDISGFYDCDENAIYVNSDEYPLRQTFTVAHELGHKILHEEWARSSDYKVLLRDQSNDGDDPREKEANAFAGHLLVPRSLLNRYWQVMNIEELSCVFAVSVPVIRNRISFEYGV